MCQEHEQEKVENQTLFSALYFQSILSILRIATQYF